MNSKLLDRRISTRIARDFAMDSAEIAQRRPRIIDFNQGGICLWLDNPPDPSWHIQALEFHYAGHKHVVHSRIVWSQACKADSNVRELAFANGWLVGFELEETEWDIWNNEAFKDILRSGHVSVSLLLDAADLSQSEIEGTGDHGLLTFSKSSSGNIKTAADELLPVFAKYFTDVRMVLTRDRLEISAPFRAPAELNQPATRRQDYRSVPADRVAESVIPTTIEQPAVLVQPRSASAIYTYRKALVSVSLAVVILGLRMPILGVSRVSWTYILLFYCFREISINL